MNKTHDYIRLLSALLALLAVLGCFGGLSVTVAAAGEEEAVEIIDYYTQVYNTPEEKLAAMEKKLSMHGYELYYENYTGEIALKDTKSGKVLFSNPYNIPIVSATSSNDTKDQLLSQLIIKYLDNDQEKNYYSFVEAAKRDQIKVKNLKNGIRVEYTMGKEETRSLVPRMIRIDRFRDLILNYIEDEQALKKMNAFYTLKDPEDPKLTVRGVKELQATFPITKKMAVYVFDPYASAREVNLIEGYIKQFCPHYTFADMDEDHSITEYEGSDKTPALFKLSLEYYLNENGLQVRLPANGIRFDETNYSLTYIQILPYMGAGSYVNKGYTFIPDGSGTIVRFEDFAGQNLTISGKLYGQDYAFHEISGQHQQVMRLPVYGVVENYTHSFETEVEKVIEAYTDDEGNLHPEETVVEKVANEDTEDRGFLAIITEGDALANITTSHGGALHKYATVYTQFYPRPKDSYNLREAISVASNATWTVVSKRKYTGSYRIQYIMLNGDAASTSSDYDVSWMGMATAYRDYLEKTGDLVKLTEVKENIPLYIESLGIIEVSEQILSIPVMVKKPLATFDDLKAMYDDLSSNGIDNVVFRLKGYDNEGLDYTYPTAMRFEDKIGGNEGYQDFVSYCNGKGIEVYPDYDFVYIGNSEVFDGVSFRRDCVKTIDDRYTSKREYDPVWQTYMRFGMLAITPSRFESLYERFNEKYSAISDNGISVSTLGSDLNSDFDKRDPYNREDSKEYTINMLERIQADHGDIVIDCGNAYALKFAKHVMNVALDSSLYYYSSQPVPFMGAILHGYKQFAGTPTNMVGDINYEILKIIENGASPFFTLCSQNTEELKNDMDTAKYYSISFDIWHDDLIEKYNILNDALKDVQTSQIKAHEFLREAERIPSAEEVKADKDAAAEEAQLLAEAAEKAAEKAEKAKKRAERKLEEEKAAALAAGEPWTDPEVDEDDEVIAAEEEEVLEDTEYVANKYTCALGTVVKVTYSNGTAFILNYNSFAIKVEGKTIEALSFIKTK